MELGMAVARRLLLALAPFINEQIGEIKSFELKQKSIAESKLL
jgi:hypothetical protein